MRDRMLQDREGRKILRERPEINTSTIDMEYLSKLPKNTFGYNYWYFLDSNKIGPDGRTPVHYVDDEELAYVINRYRQAHDFFHTLFDLNISVQEEISVKWFEMVHFQLPMNTLSALFGPLRLTAHERAELLDKSVPWALTVGSQAKFLLSAPYEKLFEKDLNELRKELNVIPHPK
jgi:ubiquinone biosynthesis protein COQ4